MSIALCVAMAFLFESVLFGLAGIPQQGTAQAADPIARIGITGQVGAGLIGMGDVNDHIGDGNLWLAERKWAEINEVKHGYNFSWDVRSRITGPFSVSVGGGQIFGQTKLDFDQVVTIRPSMNFYHLRGIYQLPFRPMGSMILSLGAGPVYIPEGKLKVEHEQRSAESGTERVETANFTGKGWGGHGFLQAELVFTEKITLITDLGYRYAKLSQDSMDWTVTGRNLVFFDADNNNIVDAYEDLTDGETYLPNSFLNVVRDGPDVRTDNAGRPILNSKDGTDLDFTGVLLNVGLRFYLF